MSQELDSKLNLHSQALKKQLKKDCRFKDGKFGAIDDLGVSYKTYAIGIKYMADHLNLDAKLKKLDGKLKALLTTLIINKSHEKPEGGEVCARGVEIRFRQWPEYKIYDGKLSVVLRLTIRHTTNIPKKMEVAISGVKK